MAADLSRYLTYYADRPDNIPDLSPEECRVIPWFVIDGNKTMRQDYGLNKDSIVYDMGGYMGEWAEDVFKKHGCVVHVFEPVKKFVDIMNAKFAGNKKIHIHEFGLDDRNHDEEISLDLASSSTFKKGKKNEKIKLIKASDFIAGQPSKKIDLIKLNIEGGEYSLLEHFIKTGQIKNINEIQLQFHEFVPNARKRRLEIQDKLNKTHRMTYNYPFIWENWRLK